MYKKQFLILLTLLLFLNAHSQSLRSKIELLKAPEKFRALITTTKGDIVVEAVREWSPIGVDRLYQLMISGFYQQGLFFRVEPNYVIQFGISASYGFNRYWDSKKLTDEPVKQKNVKGTIAFVRGGRNSRSTQLFINMVDNLELDTIEKGGTIGFTPIAKIVKGFEVLKKLNSTYAKQPLLVQDSLYKYGNDYFTRRFPGLDKILKVTIINQ